MKVRIEVNDSGRYELRDGPVKFAEISLGMSGWYVYMLNHRNKQCGPLIHEAIGWAIAIYYHLDDENLTEE
jgi:hypothetical protein